MNKKRFVAIIAGLWALVVVASVASSLTLIISGSSYAAKDPNGEYVQVTRAEYDLLSAYKRLEDIRSIVKREYYKEVEDEDLLTGAARGMLEAVDDLYTFYYSPDDMQKMAEHTEGKYAGIGVQIIGDPADKLITVTRVFRDGPAQKSGILPGDKIVMVNDTEVTSYEMNEAVVLMKGEPGTTVNVTIYRGDEFIPFVLERANISINRVEYQIVEGNIGYLSLYEFVGDDVQGFKEALKEFDKNGVKGIIIDVRGNPGGLVRDAVAITDLLLPKGLIVYTEDRYGRRQEEYSDTSSYGKPIVVLINGLSASASEILAGAVQDHKVGTIIGEKSFGKGIVQTVIPFRSDGAGMQLTTSRYFTPLGRTIHEIGITPDIEVVMEKDKVSTGFTIHDEDTQFQRAVEEIKKLIGQ